MSELHEMSVHSLLELNEHLEKQVQETEFYQGQLVRIHGEEVEKLSVQLSDERMRARDLEIACHDERRMKENAQQAFLMSERQLLAKERELERVRSALAKHQELLPEALLDAEPLLCAFVNLRDITNLATGDRGKYKNPFKMLVEHWHSVQDALASPAAEPQACTCRGYPKIEIWEPCDDYPNNAVFKWACHVECSKCGAHPKMPDRRYKTDVDARTAAIIAWGRHITAQHAPVAQPEKEDAK